MATESSGFSYDVCVVGGAGRAGLPLSIALASRNRKVLLYDINQEAVARIREGRMLFREEGAQELLSQTINRTLIASDNVQDVGRARFVIIIIGTPVDAHLNPDFDPLTRLLAELNPHLHGRQIVVLRSTVYPGSTAKIRQHLKQLHPELEVCFCPERILEGKALQELFHLPQIVSGFDERAIRETADLFRVLTPEILFASPLEAELSKLFTNAWRYIQFAIANQFYMIAEEYGANYHNIHRNMTSNYPRTANLPKPGFAAGPCLFKDTMQLSAFTNHQFQLGHSAMLVNEGLLNFIIEQLKKTMDLRQKTIGILGMAFKAESDDRRDSLSYKLKRNAEFEASRVLCSDPFIQDPGFIPADQLVRESDAVVIGAPHRVYRDLDFRGKVLIDVWTHIPADRRDP